MNKADGLSTGDLAGVIYSSGKVFDGLGTDRLDTESFLRNGETRGITSRADLALLEDLRDAMQFVIDSRDNGQPVDGAFVRQINQRLTRSAALRPGELRRDDQRIGVKTRYGAHTPSALTTESLDELVASSTRDRTPHAAALELFVQLAKAQPFEDGNKRTALFAANAYLLRQNTRTLLQVPVDDHDPQVADRFNDLLARAYIFDDHEALKTYMGERGITRMVPNTSLSAGPNEFR
ncbi:MAG: Fic family protein [Propionibacteriaceae bacterium]|nr:Fic family protein [Propionibacteriaceae bacterium]